MDKQITLRIERVGAILALSESAQLSLIQAYIKDFHLPSWELVNVDRQINGRKEIKNASLSLAKAYKSWLIRHDTAWSLSDQLLALYKTTRDNWKEMSEASGKSPQTCRQVIQALKRGGLP